MIRRMQIIHWVVMAINLMFCLSVMVLAKRSVGRVQKEQDSICDQLRRNGMAEIDRLKYLVQAHQGTIRDHKAQITDRDETIDVLQAEREEAAKRILSLEGSYSQKCVELDAKNQDLKEIKQRWDDSWRFLNLDESIVTTPTFQPKRPEEQPPKPTCDN